MANKVEVEKDRVPKMATHFESLAEKESGEAEKLTETPASLEEISNLRGAAQQNSIEAIRAAEERHKKAKQDTALKHAFKVAAEKAVAGKDVAVETSRGYAGKVKDGAVVAGWGATQYTLEKVVDATKTVAGVTSSVAEFTKDKVAGAGETVGEKLAAAKDAVVEKEERAADYAGRKKAEAQKSSREEEEGGVSLGDEEQWSDEEDEYFEEGEGGEETGGGSVFQAVGETIVEIVKTTKNLLVGQ